MKKLPATAVLAMLALGSCKPRLGGSCGKDEMRVVCSGPKSALVCAGKHWVDKPCAEWCFHRTDSRSGDDYVECADVIHPAIGDPCFLPATMSMPTEENACTSDGTSLLSCQADDGRAGGGFWTLNKTCRPGTKCLPAGGPGCITP